MERARAHSSQTPAGTVGDRAGAHFLCASWQLDLCACVKKKKKKPLLLDFLLCLLTCDTLIFKTIKELKQKLLGIYLSSTSILD